MVALSRGRGLGVWQHGGLCSLRFLSVFFFFLHVPFTYFLVPSPRIGLAAICF